MTRFACALLFLTSFAYADPAMTGSVKGTVLFEGEPPTQPIVATADKKCPQDRNDKAIVVTKGKLRDVLVRIKGDDEATPATKHEAQLIDQRDCLYTPRVVGIVAGQALVVRNHDNTFHNVHGTLHSKDVTNKMQAPKADDIAIDATTAKPGDVIELRCDVHPWMKAYAVVEARPWFAVTASDGTFEIAGIPPGTYTLETWHPVLGTRSVTVKIGKTAKLANVTARLSYKATEL